MLPSSLFKYFDMRDINEKERGREQLLQKINTVFVRKK